MALAVEVRKMSEWVRVVMFFEDDELTRILIGEDAEKFFEEEVSGG